MKKTSQSKKENNAEKEDNAEKEEINPEQTPKRRGNRSRNKPNYYGQNVMVTQLSPAREQENEEGN